MRPGPQRLRIPSYRSDGLTLRLNELLIAVRALVSFGQLSADMRVLESGFSRRYTGIIGWAKWK